MQERSTGSTSLQASARQQRQQQQPTTQRKQTPPGSVHGDGAAEEARQTEIEKDLSRKLEALSAAAKATNQRIAEVHIIGEVAADHGFNSSGGLFCEFVAGAWTPLCTEAMAPQQTQAAYASAADVYVWNHPVDLHYTMSSIVGWPCCTVCVWKMNAKDQASPLAFGSKCLPMAVGELEVVCHTWSTVGAAGEELVGKCQEVLGEAAWSSSGEVEKPQIMTRTSGRILLRLNVVTRYLDAHGISTGGRTPPSTTFRMRTDLRCLLTSRARRWDILSFVNRTDCKSQK
ncbi:hypothetical protein Esti_003235 [Eimeria stiedai]